MSVFKHADHLFRLIGRLVRRPRRGEVPEDVPDRDGLPLLHLVGDHQEGLAKQIGQSLGAARPRPVPQEFIDLDGTWKRVTDQRSDLSPEWQRAEFFRRVLVDLAIEFSSARYGRDQPVRFRRFGLVNWLLEMTTTPKAPDAAHAQEVLRRLRDREVQRRPMFRFLRSPGTEVALVPAVPWWAYLLGLHVLPLVGFRAWRALGSEYRWLLRQPYMAPGDPGTFVGFALRLTQPRWGRESPAQVSKLMVNAFLEDLRVAYRRRPWRRRAHRRTAYCVAFLKNVSTANNGHALVRSFAEVRNDTGAFDPLLVVADCSEAEAGQLPARVLSLTDKLGPYEAWYARLRRAGRAHGPEFWYLPVRVGAPLPPEDPDWQAQRDSNDAAAHVRLPRVRAWARRRVSVGAIALAVVLLAGAAACAQENERDWEERHCGLGRSHPDAATLVRQDNGECVGVASHGYSFGSDDARLTETLDVIAVQNQRAERIHRDSPERQVITLVHLWVLVSDVGGETSGDLSYAREQLQGVASAQRRQLDRGGDGDPVLRILPASAGADMRYGAEVAGIIEGMREDDPTILGVTGLDQSRADTIATINRLTRAGLPMVATTLSADSLSDHSPLYYQVSAQNRREATVAAAYAAHLAAEGRLAERSVRVLYSADPTDEYSRNLAEDAEEEFRRREFAVDSQSYTPSPSQGLTGSPGARTLGEAACGFEGLVFFAGRSEDFESVLAGTDDACGSSPPSLLAGDDVGRLVADRERRSAFRRVPYEFLDFTSGPASCDGSSDLYAIIQRLFPEECEDVESTSLDGHAALAFDAVNLYLRAVGRLQAEAPELPLTPAAVWQAIGRIHGSASLDGESGIIDFGGVVDRQVPLDKLISIQRVEGGEPTSPRGFCGRLGGRTESDWCPPPEGGADPSGERPG